MKATYLVHPNHGVHLVYTDHEAEVCKSNGWKVWGDQPPKAWPPREEAAEVSAVEEPKRKPGRPAKAK